MSLIPFADQLTALQNIYAYIAQGGMINDLINIAVGLVYSMLYIPVLVANLLYTDIQYVYLVSVTLVNMVLNIQNVINSLISTTIPSHAPSIWVSLLLLSISLNISIKVAIVASYVWGWWKKLNPA